MSTRRSIRVTTVLFALVALLSLTTTPVAGAAETDPATFEYHAADLLDGGSDEIIGETITLVPEGTATEGDTVRIEINESERSAFEFTGVSDETDDIGIAVEYTADTIEIELTDLGGDGTVTGVEIQVSVSLRASDAVASGAAEYDATTIGAIDSDGPDFGLDGESAITVSIVEAAEIGFTAEEIDENIDGSMHEVNDFDQFVLSFASEDVVVADGETINISVNPDVIKEGDESGIGIRNVAEWATQDGNISNISVSESTEANILEGHTDQVTITINTVDGERKSVSGEAIGVNIQLLIDEESMKYTANRYHNADFLEVDVEGENNIELTDNTDILTESPLLVDIYPSEVEQFELDGLEKGAEFAITENRSVGIDTAQDRFGNEIRQPTLEATLSGAEATYTTSGIEIDTADRSGLNLDRDGEIQPRLGVFDLTVEVTDIEGPATHADGAVTATIGDIAIYPDDVQVRTVAPSNDFDVDGGDIDLAVDLGVPNDEIDRLDLELRRVDGEGTVTVDRTGGMPTRTNLWEDTEYAGDDEMYPRNTWVIERELTADDFDEAGIRTYALEADTADRYEITADVMPYEDRLVANESEVGSSTVGEHGDATRGSAEIVATGPIDAVRDVSVRADHEFIGVEGDPDDDIVVDFGTFVDANGNTISRTNETVTVGLGNETIEAGVGVGSVTADVGPTANSPSATVALDPTAIDATAVETGTNATVALEFEDGRQLHGTDIKLVHRVTEPGAAGWHAGSLPQPATLYVDADGARDLTQWNPTTERYESLAAGTEDDVFEQRHLEAEHLHRGFYFRSDDGGGRLGFDFVTESEVSPEESEISETVELEEGWHLGSSNYDVSAHAQRELAEDVNWTDYGFGDSDDAFVIRDSDSNRIHDRTDGSDIDGTTAAVGHDEAYWIRVRSDDDAPLVREIVSSPFAESEGVQG